MMICGLIFQLVGIRTGAIFGRMAAQNGNNCVSQIKVLELGEEGGRISVF
jgi:hypothetical protein